jgi:fused signal recognition particle receptor
VDSAGDSAAEGEGLLQLTKPLTVFLVIGANGMGKTTTIGKLAHRLKQEGNQKVVRARRRLLLLRTP